jgi:hypothetical protein
MGIFLSNPEWDTNLIYQSFFQTAVAWNNTYSNDQGIWITVKQEACAAIATAGAELLLKTFPEDPELPSAFKRVGTFLIFSAIHPFLIARRRNSKGEFQEPVVFTDDIKDFAVSFTFTVLPILFASLERNNNGTWVQIDDWKGFISEEYETEFQSFIRWIGNSDLVTYPKSSPMYDYGRLGRIVLGASLILEANYRAERNDEPPI